MNKWFPMALFAGVLAIPAGAAALDRSAPTVTKVVTTSAAAATESAATEVRATDSIAAERPVSRPAPAKAIRWKTPATGPVERTLAGRQCRDDAFDGTAEFRFRYGRGPASMQRCIGHEARDAQAGCREEALEDPADFRNEFGTGAAARVRCVRDGLS